MGTKLVKILEDVQYNMNTGHYPRKITSKYYIHNNLKVVIDNHTLYYGGDHNYYYFFIWLLVLGGFNHEI